MRTILFTDDEREFARAWSLLQQKGIPVFEQINNFDTLGLDVPRTHGRALSIWLDDQYEDAKNLLRDPSYVVSCPVDLGEFARIQKKAKKQRQRSSSRSTEKLLNWLFALIAVAVIGGIAFAALR